MFLANYVVRRIRGFAHKTVGKMFVTAASDENQNVNREPPQVTNSVKEEEEDDDDYESEDSTTDIEEEIAKEEEEEEEAPIEDELEMAASSVEFRNYSPKKEINKAQLSDNIAEKVVKSSSSRKKRKKRKSRLSFRVNEGDSDDLFEDDEEEEEEEEKKKEIKAIKSRKRRRKSPQIMCDEIGEAAGFLDPKDFQSISSPNESINFDDIRSAKRQNINSMMNRGRRRKILLNGTGSLSSSHSSLHRNSNRKAYVEQCLLSMEVLDATPDHLLEMIEEAKTSSSSSSASIRSRVPIEQGKHEQPPRSPPLSSSSSSKTIPQNCASNKMVTNKQQTSPPPHLSIEEEVGGGGEKSSDQLYLDKPNRNLESIHSSNFSSSSGEEKDYINQNNNNNYNYNSISLKRSSPSPIKLRSLEEIFQILPSSSAAKNNYHHHHHHHHSPLFSGLPNRNSLTSSRSVHQRSPPSSPRSNSKTAKREIILPKCDMT